MGCISCKITVSSEDPEAENTWSQIWQVKAIPFANIPFYESENHKMVIQSEREIDTSTICRVRHNSQHYPEMFSRRPRHGNYIQIFDFSINVLGRDNNQTQGWSH